MVQHTHNWLIESVWYTTFLSNTNFPGIAKTSSSTALQPSILSPGPCFSTEWSLTYYTAVCSANRHERSPYKVPINPEKRLWRKEECGGCGFSLQTKQRSLMTFSHKDTSVLPWLTTSTLIIKQECYWSCIKVEGHLLLPFYTPQTLHHKQHHNRSISMEDISSRQEWQINWWS